MVEAALSAEESPSKPILESCVGLFLFGVPNKGLKEENLSSLLKGRKSAPFMTSLGERSELLELLRRQFHHTHDKHLKSCCVVSFFETKDSPTVKVVTIDIPQNNCH